MYKNDPWPGHKTIQEGFMENRTRTWKIDSGQVLVGAALENNSEGKKQVLQGRWSLGVGCGEGCVVTTTQMRPDPIVKSHSKCLYR